jgi:hypothetical protein
MLELSREDDDDVPLLLYYHPSPSEHCPLESLRKPCGCGRHESGYRVINFSLNSSLHEEFRIGRMLRGEEPERARFTATQPERAQARLQAPPPRTLLPAEVLLFPQVDLSTTRPGKFSRERQALDSE